MVKGIAWSSLLQTKQQGCDLVHSKGATGEERGAKIEGKSGRGPSYTGVMEYMDGGSPVRSREK